MYLIIYLNEKYIMFERVVKLKQDNNILFSNGGT